jgi:hypothetical protein
LAGELSPSGVSDGAGQVPVGQKIGHGEVFQAQPIVGLDELQRVGRVVTTDRGPVGRSCHGERGQSAIHPDEARPIFR